MVMIFVSIIEFNYVIVYLTFCFLAPKVHSVGDNIRHQAAGEFSTLQDSDGRQTKTNSVPLKLPVLLTAIDG